MTHDPLDHLRRLDPARKDPPAPEDVEALLARVKAHPSEDQAARKLRLRRPAVALAALALVAFCVALFASGREAEMSYAARANAAVSGAEDVVHAHLRTTVRGPRGQVTRVRDEEWWLRPSAGGFARVIVPNVRAQPNRRLVTVAEDGMTTTWSNRRVVQRVTGQIPAERAGVFDPGALFRRAYREKRVRDLGPRTSAAGQRLRRFAASEGNVSIVYDADATSWAPVQVNVTVQDASEPRPRSTETTSVRLYEHTADVPPTTTLLRR